MSSSPLYVRIHNAVYKVPFKDHMLPKIHMLTEVDREFTIKSTAICIFESLLQPTSKASYVCHFNGAPRDFNNRVRVALSRRRRALRSTPTYCLLLLLLDTGNYPTKSMKNSGTR